MDCVLFNKKLETGCLKIDLDFPVVVNLKMHQIASLGPYFLNINFSKEQAPGPLLVACTRRALSPMPGTSYFELGTGY